MDVKVKILVFFGMTASGKSTLGQAFARANALPYYNTDRVRKELAGLSPTDKRPDGVMQGIYSAQLTSQTYQVMLDNCCNDLEQGAEAVVLDGSYARKRDRDRVRRLAGILGAEVVFILCSCSEKEVRRRLARRQHDTTAVSDGRMEIYRHQQKTFEAPVELPPDFLITIHTEHQVGQLLAELAACPLLAVRGG